MQLFIACPVYKQEHPAHRAAREATVAYFHGAAVYHRLPGDSCLARARATLFGIYLQRDRPWTHFLQVDDDISWDPRNLEQMIACDRPILCGLCAFKSDAPEYRGRTTTRALPNRHYPDPDNTIPVQYCGGGFLLWQDRVLRDLSEVHPELAFRTNPGRGDPIGTYNLWGQGLVDRADGSREFLSEDYWACHLAAELGYQPRAYLAAAMPHWNGDKAFVPSGFEPPAWKAPSAEAA